MLKIILLICPSYLDHAHCDLGTATDTIRSATVTSPQQCGFMGQAMLGPTAFVPDPTKEYVKIVCLREQDASR